MAPKRQRLAAAEAAAAVGELEGRPQSGRQGEALAALALACSTCDPSQKH
jgi:hypothetical protein